MISILPKEFPHSLEAERSVLGAVLHDSRALAKASKVLNEEDFYLTAHQVIYRAMLTLLEAGLVIDQITLPERLKANGELRVVGGAAYIADLWTEVASAANVSPHAQIVRENAIRRQTIMAARRVEEAAFSDAPLAELAKHAERFSVPLASDTVASPEDPEPIALDTQEMPSFPTGVIPAPWFRDMVDATSAATETPVELALLLGLAAIATVVHRKYVVEPESGYVEQLNLWVCPALDSGNRKTSVLREMTSPLLDFERQHAATIAADVCQAEAARQLSEDRIKYLRQQAARAEGAERTALQQELFEEQAAQSEVPKALRLWCQDVTPEKLGQLMADHGEKMAILSDEGGLFDILAGRYTQGALNLDLFCKRIPAHPTGLTAVLALQSSWITLY